MNVSREIKQLEEDIKKIEEKRKNQDEFFEIMKNPSTTDTEFIEALNKYHDFSLKIPYDDTAGFPFLSDGLKNIIVNI